MDTKELKELVDFIKSESSFAIKDYIDQCLGAAWIAGRDTNVSVDPAVEANRQALLDRSNVGIVKYGTTLMDNKGDLRYWANHALEEALDMANYLRRLIMEIDNQNKFPENVYYLIESDNFYSLETNMGMGTPFYEKWKSRASEFPKINKI